MKNGGGKQNIATYIEKEYPREGNECILCFHFIQVWIFIWTYVTRGKCLGNLHGSSYSLMSQFNFQPGKFFKSPNQESQIAYSRLLLHRRLPYVCILNLEVESCVRIRIWEPGFCGTFLQVENLYLSCCICIHSSFKHHTVRMNNRGHSLWFGGQVVWSCPSLPSSSFETAHSTRASQLFQTKATLCLWRGVSSPTVSSGPNKS